MSFIQRFWISAQNREIYQRYWIGKRKKQTETDKNECVSVGPCVLGISVWKLDARLCRSPYRDNVQPIHTSLTHAHKLWQFKMRKHWTLTWSKTNPPKNRKWFGFKAANKKNSMLKSDDWQDLWNTRQPYWLLLSLHVTTLLSAWDKATFYIPPEASLICANSRCQTSWNEFRRQASTPPGCFNHTSRHRLLSPRASSSSPFENKDDLREGSWRCFLRGRW